MHRKEDYQDDFMDDDEGEDMHMDEQPQVE